MRPTLIALLVLLAVPTLAFAAPCEGPDHLTRVTGGRECLVIRTAAKPGDGPPVLYVLLHGGHGDGSPAVSFYRFADALVEQGPPGTIAVALIRPGYRDDKGQYSGGNGGVDDWHAHNLDLLADAIARLKDFHRAGRLVLVGQSAGAAVAGVLIGRHPGLAGAAVLIGCPCQMGPWRAGKGQKSIVWTSESPDAWIDQVPPGTQVALLVGEDDRETSPALSEGYAAQLRKRGVPVGLTILEGHGHISPLRTQRVLDAALRMGRGLE